MNAALMAFPSVNVIDENSAAAIKYGTDRSDQIKTNNSSFLACIFNVGSSSTTVSVVQYSAYKTLVSGIELLFR